MINVLDLAENDTQLKKAATTGGGEYSGSCPFCGGKDRFRVQPNKKDGGRWYCRGCGENRWHDVYDYVMRRDNIGYPQAKRLVEGDYQEWKPIKQAPAIIQIAQDHNSEVWQKRSTEFTDWCAKNLLDPMGDETTEWLWSRGIPETVIMQAKLGYNPTDIKDKPERWGYPINGDPVYLSHGLIIPNWNVDGIHGIKIRRGDTDKKYIQVKGSSIWLYGGWTISHNNHPSTAYLFESELDALTGFSTGYGLAFLSLPAGQHISAEHGSSILRDLTNVLICPDNDEPGLAHAARLAGLPGFYAAPPCPQGKDLAEYYQISGNGASAILDYLYDCAVVIPPEPYNLAEIMEIPLDEQ
jgi:DNA primase